jgi:hypothetical protein
MKTLLMAVVVIAGASLGAAAERPRLREREAPRATDLLRAERMAEQARKRLKLPARHGAGWQHGGSGWDSADLPAEHEPGSVAINVRPARRRPASR